MTKLLEGGMIYPILGSAWVSYIQVVPKKAGMTVIQNENNKLIPTRTVIWWRMCIDYRKLKQATRKYHSKCWRDLLEGILYLLRWILKLKINHNGSIGLGENCIYLSI